jgi:hypothetical protein
MRWRLRSHCWSGEVERSFAFSPKTVRRVRVPSNARPRANTEVRNGRVRVSSFARLVLVIRAGYGACVGRFV